MEGWEEAATAGLFAALVDSSSGLSWLEESFGATEQQRRFSIWVFRGSFYRVFFLSDDLAAYRKLADALMGSNHKSPH